jgi:hypothetical protein
VTHSSSGSGSISNRNSPAATDRLDFRPMSKTDARLHPTGAPWAAPASGPRASFGEILTDGARPCARCPACDGMGSQWLNLRI